MAIQIGSAWSVVMHLIVVLLAMFLFFICRLLSQFHYSGYRAFTFMMWWALVMWTWSVVVSALGGLLLFFPTYQLQRHLVLTLAALELVIGYVLLGTLSAGGAVHCYLAQYNKLMKCSNCVTALYLGGICSAILLASAYRNLWIAAKMFP